MLPIVVSAMHNQHEGPPDADRRPLRYHHDSHVVCCLLQGAGVYQCGRNEFRLPAPWLCVLPAGDLDGNGLVGSYESMYAVFDWPGVKSVRGELVELSGTSGSVRREHIRKISGAELSRTVAIYKQLLVWVKRADVASQLRAGAAILDLLALWSTPVATTESRGVLAYRDLIERHAFDAEVTLEQLADKVGMTAEHLGVLFKRDTGQTPVAYRESMRIARAKELLVTMSLPVSEVADAAGFSDANYFARVFKRLTGLRPSEFASHQPLARRP